jgi:tetratricopeptide (TPR) repeat protein
MIRVIILNFIWILFASCSGQKKKEIYNHKAIELNNKATELLRRSNNDSALILFDKAIAIDETYYIPHSNKVGIYITKKEYDKALYEIEMIIKKKPDLAEGWTYAGMLREGLGDTLVAKKYYEKSVEIFNERILNPEKEKQIIANRLNRAVSLILLGQEKDGKEELKKLKGEKPDYKFIDELIKKNKQDFIHETLKNAL